MNQGALARDIAQRLGQADIAGQWAARNMGTETRYAIVDNLLPTEQVEAIHDAFAVSGEAFTQLSSFRERKRTSARFDALPPVLREITFAFQQPEVVRLIAEQIDLVGIAGDPTLYAGGVSMMGRGDFLNPHIDNSHNAARNCYRRVNLLYYVTPDWREADGGNLELWDRDVSAPLTLHSRFNRLVLMETNRRSWHSVSPVRVDRNRCCVSNYYFSRQSPLGRDYFHVTSFSARPEQRARRVLASIDAMARSVAGHLGLGRGRRHAFRPQVASGS